MTDGAFWASCVARLTAVANRFRLPAPGHAPAAAATTPAKALEISGHLFAAYALFGAAILLWWLGAVVDLLDGILRELRRGDQFRDGAKMIRRAERPATPDDSGGVPKYTL